MILKTPAITPAVSIIVPVYNAGAYLSKCLRSIAGQTMGDYEVLLVYEKSSDDSLAVLQSYAAADPRFHILQNPGSGVSAARNAGIQAACGKYIAFVDSDDQVSEDYLRLLYGAAERTGAEIVCCNYRIRYEQSGLSLTHPHPARPGVYPAKKLLKMLIRDHRLKFYLWNKLWKRSLFVSTGVRFPDMCFEDTPVSTALFYHAKKVAVIPQALYEYLRHDGSLSAQLCAVKLNHYLYALCSIRSILELHGDFAPYRWSFYLHSNRIFFTNFRLIWKIHAGDRCFSGLIGNLRRSAAAVLSYCAADFHPVERPETLPAVILPPGAQSSGNTPKNT